jgi:hypothetical protein
MVDSSIADIIDDAPRPLRGGSWSYFARDLRSANHANFAPANRNLNWGFRLAGTCN